MNLVQQNVHPGPNGSLSAEIVNAGSCMTFVLSVLDSFGVEEHGATYFITPEQLSVLRDSLDEAFNQHDTVLAAEVEAFVEE